MAEAPVVELRIHGVGGSSPERLLGERHPDDVVRLRVGHRTGLWARRADPTVQGYVWGGLTAGSRLQPLWVVLLPFTLCNVAGWMHPPLTASARRRQRVQAVRVLVTVLGTTLTASWVLWLAVIGGDYLAFQEGAGLAADPATAGWVAGAGATVAAAGVVWRGWPPLLAGGALLVAVGAALQWSDLPRARAVGGVVAAQAVLALVVVVAGATGRSFGRPSGLGPRWAARRNDDLRNPAFFTEFRGSARLLAVHAAVAGVTLALVVARAWTRAGTDPLPGSLDLGSSLVALGAVQSVLVAALAALSIGPLRGWAGRWRVAGPAVAATLALVLTTAVFGGLALFVSRQAGTTVTGAELALLDVFALVLAAVAALVALAWAPAFLRGGPGPDRRRARRERLARAPRHLDVILTSATAAFVLASAWATVARVDTAGSLVPWDWRIDAARSIGPFRDAAVWLLAFVVPALGLVVRAGVRSLSARRNIGNLWDVLTFWPRRFHPLAVRPYTEHAVPELRDLVHQALGRPGGAVLVSAHSQGSVLAFAALSSLVAEEDCRDRLALVTYGSPLELLHVAFPGYVGPAELAFLHANLADWRNFYRRTDHIGGPLSAPVPVNEELADPAVGASDLAPTLGATPRPALEPDRVAGPEMAGHNDYLREPRVKAWVAATKERLAGTAGPPPESYSHG